MVFDLQPAVVLDNGNEFLLAGISTDQQPQIIPNIVGKPKVICSNIQIFA